MISSTQSPKKPSKVLGWSLIVFAVAFSLLSAVLFWVVGNAIGGAIGGALQAFTVVFVVVVPYKILIYGRRRMAERAEKLLALD